MPPLVLFLGNHPAVKPEHLATIRVILSGAAPLGFTDVEKVHAKAKNIRIGQGKQTILSQFEKLQLDNFFFFKLRIWNDRDIANNTFFT